MFLVVKSENSMNKWTSRNQLKVSLRAAIINSKELLIWRSNLKEKWVIWSWRGSLKLKKKSLRRNSSNNRNPPYKHPSLEIYTHMLVIFFIGIRHGRLQATLWRKFLTWTKLGLKKVKKWRLWGLLKTSIENWWWYGSCFIKIIKFA